MYFVKYGKEYLHDPRVDDYMLLDLTLDGEENSCGFCDFTIYPSHPMYDKLKERDADNPIEVYDDDILLFSGFIYELGKEFYLGGHVKCKGELDYLSESIIRPYSTHQRGYGDKVPDTPSKYFEWLIEQHNRQVQPNKKFTIGINQASWLDSNGYIFRESNEYPNTIDEIKDKLLNIIGGYLRTRHENGIRYIDYLSSWTESNTQILDFGVNLTDYTQTDDALDVATFVVPIGARMSETEYAYNDGYFVTSDTTVVSGKEYYTKSENGYSQCYDLKAFESGVTYYEYNKDDDESDLPLTVAGIDDGSYGEQDYTKIGDMIYCESAVKKYGNIGFTYKNTDITIKENLVKAGITALKELVSPKRTIEIKAVDMHLVNPNIKPIRIGEYVRVRSKPHNLDSYFLCVNIDLDLNNPENSLYTLGTTFDTLTGQQNKKINELNATINSIYESAESASGTAKEASTSVYSAYSEARKAATESIVAKNEADQAMAKTELVESQVTEIVQSVSNTDAKAEEAISKATASAEAAGEASAIAEQIQNEISDIKGSATSLRDAIDSQIETKVTTMTADYVSTTKLTETKTELETSISQSATVIKAEAEQEYAKKTELTDVKSSLETSISLNSDSILATAKDVEIIQVDVSSAQTAANIAKDLANAAQSAADAAGADATEAKSAAQTAQDLADAVQNDVNSLQNTVTKKFTEFELTADGLQTTVSETKEKIDEASTRISTLEQDAEGFTARLNRFKVGGRNLLVGTSNPFTHTGTGGTNQSSYVYDTSAYYNALPSLDGIQLTLSFRFETTATSGTFCIQLNDDPWTMLTDIIDVSTNQNGVYTYTVTCDSGFDTGSYWGIQLRTDDLTGDVTIRDVILELGCNASSWQEAPEDISSAVNNAASTATNYLNFSELGLIIGNMIAESLGKNVLIDENSVNIRDADTILAKFAKDTIEFAKQVVFKADGIFLDNGDAFAHLGRNNVLWSGAYYMHGTQSIDLSANITRQLSGAVFVWSYYNGTSALDQDFTYFFVPKSHIENNPGDGIRMSDPYLGMMKYLYVSNGVVSGHSNNASSGTTNGIAWDNKNYVLRYVIGV